MEMNFDALEVEWVTVLDQFAKLTAKHKVSAVPRPEFMLLHLIAKSRSGAVKISDLASALGVTVPAVSKLLKLLENKRAIARVNDLTDRRITYIALTGVGRQLYDNALRDMRTAGLSVMARIGEREFRQFFEEAQRIYTAFEEVLSEQEETTL